MLVVAAACGPTPAELGAPVRRQRLANERWVAEAERLWAERLDPAKCRAAIGAWRRAVEVADDDAKSWLALARASYFLADGFLDLDHGSNEEVTATFEQGAAYADRGLRALSATYEERRQGGADVDEAAVGLGVEVVPFIYWWGLNVIRWADRVGWTAAARVYKHVRRAMELVGELEPGYDHAGAARYLAAFYIDAPGIAGGDTRKGKNLLDQALAAEPEYLENWVVLAERYAKKTHDEELYEKARRHVLDAQPDAASALFPEQEIARKKARNLQPHL
jgi:hypothetical protein